MNDNYPVEPDEPNEVTIRLAARRAGLGAHKSRARLSMDNLGGWRLIDPNRNFIVAGERFNMTGNDVLDWCEEQTPVT